MRLLILQCGIGSMPAALSEAAAKMRPKPAVISTMTLDLSRVNIPEMKHMFNHLAPDTIVVLPPKIAEPTSNFQIVLTEVIRQVNIQSGRVMLVSSVEAIGDATQRTEVGVSMAYSEMGSFLLMAETQIEANTSRHYIVRLPLTKEDATLNEWLEVADPNARLLVPSPIQNAAFNLVDIHEVAEQLMQRLESGWFGRFHMSPNDTAILSELLVNYDWKEEERVPERTLMSKYTWKLTPSEDLWDRWLEEKYGKVAY